ncbi:hypothetical protein [Streptomyces minutiscleroticus]|uniref:hypothetical protein n=1 Tax=Streptomyces minutiscleroticus TaxID=68238 RepID=UPI0035710FCA
MKPTKAVRTPDAPPAGAGRERPRTPRAAGTAPAPAAGTGASGHGPALLAALPWTAVALLAVLLLAVVARLPWAGDLGMHAATVLRLREDLVHPGNPLVDAATPSPYYSPWTVLLGGLARISGLSVFVVLRGAALVALTLLATGIVRYVRTLGGRRAAPALAVLCVLFLWGTERFMWSGFPGLHSLALGAAYPSALALGLAFHFWALLTRALRGPAGWPAFCGLGAMWAVILLCHQFSGVVASLGALAAVLGARGLPRAVRPRLAAALLLGLAVLALWPYYDFFALFGADSLDAIHRPLYREPLAHYGLALLGVAALAVRLRRDRRDPLVLFFALGALLYAAGRATGHYSWGRALPAALIPAQLAAALAVTGDGRAAVRRTFGVLLVPALLAGFCAQSGALGYVIRPQALPAPLADHYRKPWTGYHWTTPWVRYGDVVMAERFPARQIPAYGPYTVAPGYPDFFLPDEDRREAAVRGFYAAGTSAGERARTLRRYGVRWVVAPRARAAEITRGLTNLRERAAGPGGGQVLYEVVDGGGRRGPR